MGSTTHRHPARTGLAALAVAGVATLGMTGGTAHADHAAGTWATAAKAAVSTTATSAYTCFVTYPGGSTNVQYSLTFTGDAPAQVSPRHPYIAKVDFPVITPNPAINEQVQDVTFKVQLPAGAMLLTYQLTGGSGVAPDVGVAGDVVTVHAAGPFPANVAFQFPSISFLLLAGPGGTESLNQFGAGLSDPAFSWVRTDPAGTLRPFACFIPAATRLTATTVG